MIITAEHPGEEEVELEGEGCPEEPVSEMESMDPPEVSLNSVLGIDTPRTMKMKGEILSQDVVVMIDPRATHNFISNQTVQKLTLPITPTKEFGVTLGTGEAVQGRGKCQSVVLYLQGITIIEDFLPLDLGNPDLILGIQWLSKLGTMTNNWRTQVLKFKRGQESVVLKGDPSLGRTLISLKAMVRTIRKEGGGYLVELNRLEGGGNNLPNPNTHPAIQAIIDQHPTVFSTPQATY